MADIAIFCAPFGLGGVMALIGCLALQVSLSSFADAVTPGLGVAHALGRLDNYSNQERFDSPLTL